MVFKNIVPVGILFVVFTVSLNEAASQDGPKVTDKVKNDFCVFQSNAFGFIVKKL